MSTIQQRIAELKKIAEQKRIEAVAKNSPSLIEQNKFKQTSITTDGKLTREQKIALAGDLRAAANAYTDANKNDINIRSGLLTSQGDTSGIRTPSLYDVGQTQLYQSGNSGNVQFGEYNATDLARIEQNKRIDELRKQQASGYENFINSLKTGRGKANYGGAVYEYDVYSDPELTNLAKEKEYYSMSGSPASATEALQKIKEKIQNMYFQSDEYLSLEKEKERIMAEDVSKTARGFATGSVGDISRVLGISPTSGKEVKVNPNGTIKIQASENIDEYRLAEKRLEEDKNYILDEYKRKEAQITDAIKSQYSFLTGERAGQLTEQGRQLLASRIYELNREKEKDIKTIDRKFEDILLEERKNIKSVSQKTPKSIEDTIFEKTYNTEYVNAVARGMSNSEAMEYAFQQATTKVSNLKSKPKEVEFTDKAILLLKGGKATLENIGLAMYNSGETNIDSLRKGLSNIPGMTPELIRKNIEDVNKTINPLWKDEDQEIVDLRYSMDNIRNGEDNPFIIRSVLREIDKKYGSDMAVAFAGEILSDDTKSMGVKNQTLAFLADISNNSETKKQTATVGKTLLERDEDGWKVVYSAEEKSGSSVPLERVIPVAQMAFGTGRAMSDRDVEIAERYIKENPNESPFVLAARVLGYSPTRNKEIGEYLISKIVSNSLEKGLSGFGELASLSEELNKNNRKDAIRRVEGYIYDQLAKNKQEFVSETVVRTTNERTEKLKALLQELQSIEKNPIGNFKGTIQEWLGRFKSKKAQELASKVTSLITDFAHGNMGANMTKVELDFYRDLLPRLGDKPQNFITKINEMNIRGIQSLNSARAYAGLPQIETWEQLKDWDSRAELYEKNLSINYPQEFLQEAQKYNIPQENYYEAYQEWRTENYDNRYRTDRNNNPAAFTTDWARLNGGLVEGEDYEIGDQFPPDKEGKRPNLWTAKLKDPIETTIKAFDNASQKGVLRGWSYTDEIPELKSWKTLTRAEKVGVIKKMYQREGGETLSKFLY